MRRPSCSSRGSPADPGPKVGWTRRREFSAHNSGGEFLRILRHWFVNRDGPWIPRRQLWPTRGINGGVLDLIQINATGFGQQTHSKQGHHAEDDDVEARQPGHVNGDEQLVEVGS